MCKYKYNRNHIFIVRQVILIKAMTSNMQNLVAVRFMENILCTGFKKQNLY